MPNCLVSRHSALRGVHAGGVHAQTSRSDRPRRSSIPLLHNLSGAQLSRSLTRQDSHSLRFCRPAQRLGITHVAVADSGLGIADLPRHLCRFPLSRSIQLPGARHAGQSGSPAAACPGDDRMAQDGVGLPVCLDSVGHDFRGTASEQRVVAVRFARGAFGRVWNHRLVLRRHAARGLEHPEAGQKQQDRRDSHGLIGKVRPLERLQLRAIGPGQRGRRGLSGRRHHKSVSIPVGDTQLSGGSFLAVESLMNCLRHRLQEDSNPIRILQLSRYIGQWLKSISR